MELTMEYEDLTEAEEVAAEFRERARELREQVKSADLSHGLMLQTLARDYERRAVSLELYVRSVRAIEGPDPRPTLRIR